MVIVGSLQWFVKTSSWMFSDGLHSQSRLPAKNIEVIDNVGISVQNEANMFGLKITMFGRLLLCNKLKVCIDHAAAALNASVFAKGSRGVLSRGKGFQQRCGLSDLRLTNPIFELDKPYQYWF